MAANQSGHQKGGASGGARAADESESGSEATDLSNSDNEQTWISWFCSLRVRPPAALPVAPVSASREIDV
jgi:hypothetical protein